MTKQMVIIRLQNGEVLQGYSFAHRWTRQLVRWCSPPQ